MRRKHYPLNIMSRANLILSVWEHIGMAVMPGNLSPDTLTSDIVHVNHLEEQIREKETQLRHLRNQRDAAYMSLWQTVKRSYEAVKCLYGDDSIEYELVGRKRMSEKKPSSRTSKMN